MLHLCPAVLACAILSLPLAAQQSLVQTGDVFPGFGTVSNVQSIDLAGSHWASRVAFDSLVGSLVRDGVVEHLEGTGMGMMGPPGATYRSAIQVDFNESGDYAAVLSIYLAGGSTSRGVYLNGRRLLRRNGPIDATGVPPNATWSELDCVWIDDSNNLIVSGERNDEDLMVLYEIDPLGDLQNGEVMMRAGETLPGHPSPVEELPKTKTKFAMNDSGHKLFFVDDEDTTPGGTAIPCQDSWLIMDGQDLVREGDPLLPLPRRDYDRLTACEVDLNNSGDYVLKPLLDTCSGFGEAIIKNSDELVAVIGSPVPGLLNSTLSSIASYARIRITEEGRVIWQGGWVDDGVFSYDAIFVDDVAVVLTGTTRVQGKLVVDFHMNNTSSTYEITDDEGELAFLAELEDGTLGAFLVELPEGLGQSYCSANPNSTGLPARIRATGYPSLLAGPLVLRADHVPNEAGVFLFGTTAIQLPFGNGNRCAGGSVIRMNAPTLAQGNQARLDGNPVDLGIPVGTRYFQYWFRDSSGGGAGFNLSDGLEITFVP